MCKWLTRSGPRCPAPTAAMMAQLWPLARLAFATGCRPPSWCCWAWCLSASFPSAARAARTACTAASTAGQSLGGSGCELKLQDCWLFLSCLVVCHEQCVLCQGSSLGLCKRSRKASTDVCVCYVASYRRSWGAYSRKMSFGNWNNSSMLLEGSFMCAYCIPLLCASACPEHEGLC